MQELQGMPTTVIAMGLSIITKQINYETSVITKHESPFNHHTKLLAIGRIIQATNTHI